ncbi:hypothetical protein DXG01_002412 [Tephrocybe rancida]|nr:hypothetical protein DXG01_002412 [Tephrocybe rancida]
MANPHPIAIRPPNFCLRSWLKSANHGPLFTSAVLELQAKKGWSDEVMWNLVPKEFCGYCGFALGRKTARFCSGCLVDKECQTSHWPSHKVACALVSPANEANLSDLSLKWCQAYSTHVITMYNILIGIHEGQTRAYQQMLAAKAMLRVVLRKREGVSAPKSYRDLVIISWAKIDASDTFLDAQQQVLRERADKVMADTLQSRLPGESHDILLGSCLSIVLPDESRSGAAVYHTFLCDAIPARLSMSNGPCSAGSPWGLTAGDVERLFAAHMQDALNKHNKGRTL